MARRLFRALVVIATLASRASAEPALPETQLKLRLIGTVVAAESARSVAVIQNGGATAVVRAGDAIGGARVQEIRKDEVVLTQSGRLERLVLASDRVRHELERRHFAVLKADWTRRDEAIRLELARFGKAGVPLYVLWFPDAPDAPRVLPELITVDGLVDALAEEASGGA